MPDNFNPNGSGAQDALREDRAAEADIDSIKDNVKNKAQQKGSDALKNKFGKNKPEKGDLTNGKGGAENIGDDASPDASGDTPDDSGKKPGLMGKKPEPNSVKDVANKAVIAGKAASTGAKAAMLAKILGFMKMAMGMIQQGVAAVVSAIPAWLAAIGNAIVAGVHAVGGFLASVGGAIVSGVSALAVGIGSALGVGVTAATATAIATIGGVGVATAAIICGVIMSATDHKYDGNVPDCATSVKAVQTKAAEVDADAVMFENAKKIYSVMKTFGLSDEQIAGMLGNWQIESGIDPTTIEGIYNEPKNIQGPRHQDAMKDWDAYVRGPLSRNYASSGRDYTQNSGYTASDGKKYPGIGLVQWTGGGAMNFLNLATSLKKEWWTIDYQLAYMLAKDAPTGQYGKQFWPTYKSQSGSASAASTWFAQYFEGNTTMAIPKRAEAAEKWLAQEKGWSVDANYGNSIIAMAKDLGDVATDGAVANKLKTCVRAMNYDNSTLANAAVSYAYETIDEGRNNDGTPLYRRLHEVIWPGDQFFQSCDRGVATAVVWSGTDEEFPAGPSEGQLAYLNSSDKWTKVGDSSHVKMAELMPGDVFCLNGHIFLYVGHEAVAAKYPNTGPKIDSVSASLNERSPGCGNDANDIIERLNGNDWIGRGVYQIFRCSKPDGGKKYKDAGAGAN